MGENDDIIKDFLVESHENLDRMDRDIVDLEKNPTDREILSSIFRTIHTIKSTCGFFSFSKLEFISHEGESLLALLREGELRLNEKITSGLLNMSDAIRAILKNIEKSGNEGKKDYIRLVDKLKNLQKKGETGITKDHIQEETAEIENHVPTVSENSIRVDVRLLDRLMNLMGELVLTRNQILQHTLIMQDASFLATSQKLNLITTDLQEGVLKARMQPIENIWAKLPRVVRDLAVASGKEVRIEMEGKDTELDKTVIELIKDPLMHLVRNSVDHGIESPSARKKNGKNEEGLIKLRAFHEGGEVYIEISDDGGGINYEKIKEKALENNLVTLEQVQKMREKELLNLVFLPGFSTAEKVTSISGRGVGLDVVKVNIEKIRGTIDIKSKLGQGTTFKIKIPLTLAIIPALLIASGGNRYVIPQVNLLELVHLEGIESMKEIEMIQESPVYRLRGQLIPIVYLNKELKLNSGGISNKSVNSLNIVVLQALDRQFGLVVDEIKDTQEIVVKPLGKHLQNISIYAGATILGDGKVALILDVLGLAQRSSVVSEVHDYKEIQKEFEGKGENEKAVEYLKLLVCKSSDDGRIAIPLLKVARLERFNNPEIEKVGGREVIQYRNHIMPLLRFSTVLIERRKQPRSQETISEKVKVEKEISVVVHTVGEMSIGFVTEQIIDIVEQAILIKEKATRKEILFTAVIQGRVTEVLDVESVIKKFEPSFFSQGGK